MTSIVYSNAPVFKNYQSGIITANADECNPKKANLNVLIVGYGKDDETGQGFFIVKNNWGTKWGEQGYARISDSNDNVCGILTKGWLYQISG